MSVRRQIKNFLEGTLASRMSWNHGDSVQSTQNGRRFPETLSESELVALETLGFQEVLYLKSIYDGTIYALLPYVQVGDFQMLCLSSSSYDEGHISQYKVEYSSFTGATEEATPEEYEHLQNTLRAAGLSV